MKFLLILLLAFPCYSQFRPTQHTDVPCSSAMERAGKVAINSLKQGGMDVNGKYYALPRFYKSAKIACSIDGNLILAIKLRSFMKADEIVELMKAKVEPALAGKGISRVIIEGHYWETYETGRVNYRVTPVRVITTQTDSTTISTVTGGNVIESGRYGHKAQMAVAVIDY